jgi:hypothetical protein
VHAPQRCYIFGKLLGGSEGWDFPAGEMGAPLAAWAGMFDSALECAGREGLEKARSHEEGACQERHAMGKQVLLVVFEVVSSCCGVLASASVRGTTHE